MKRADVVIPAHITRFIDKAVSIAKETVVGRPTSAIQRDEGGYAEWVLLAIPLFGSLTAHIYDDAINKAVNGCTSKVE